MNYLDAARTLMGMSTSQVAVAGLMALLVCGYVGYFSASLARRWYQDPKWLLLKFSTYLLIGAVSIAMVAPLCAHTTNAAIALQQGMHVVLKTAGQPVIFFGLGAVAPWAINHPRIRL